MAYELSHDNFIPSVFQTLFEIGKWLEAVKVAHWLCVLKKSKQIGEIVAKTFVGIGNNTYLYAKEIKKYARNI